MPNAPAWLSEGLAEYYSTFRFDPAAGKSVVGSVLPNHVQWLRQETMIPLDDLLSRDGASKILRSGNYRQVATFYAESWGLVHYLMLSGSRSGEARFTAYLAATGRGEPIGQAFRSAFGMTTADAATRLAAYAKQTTFPMLGVPQLADTIMIEPVVTPLTEAEATFVQGDLLGRLGVRAEAERTLERALALDPSSSEAKLALAILRFSPGQASATIDALRPIADAEPGNLRAHLALAEAYGAAERYEEALAEYSKAIASNDQATAGWFGRAVSALALGRDEESDKAVAQLQAIDGMPNWYRSMAYQGFDLGNFGAAARNARAFIDSAGRGADSSPYMALVGSVSLGRLGRQADGEKLLAEIRPDVAPQSWVSRVLDFMQGRLDSERLLSSAKDVNEQTEAHAYIGFQLLAAGQRDEAVAHLRWVTEHGTRTFYEYGMAAAELKRIAKAAAEKK